MRGPMLIAALVVAPCLIGCRTGEPSAGSEQPKTEQATTAPEQATTETPEANQPEAEVPETQQPEAQQPVDGFFMAEGAPQPRACTVAADCLGDTIPDLAQPCCQNPRTLEPYARAYRTWLNGWRGEHCDAVTCPPPPAPSLPPDCAFEVACEAGQCVDSCP